ncbi:MAG: hypothetical protein J7M12_01905, partial [Candidatus Hydrogenedentes bacterium]|nr:hypothetical protein [Candidatus Hydrogenedentota bacterium]
MNISGKNNFVFENYGGVYQLRIRTADDLAALDRLDEPFWMATSAPVDQFTCDPVLLDRLDPDGSGRIHSSEIRQTARWLLRMLSDRSGIETRKEDLQLDALDTSHDEGKRLYDTARLIKQNLGDPDGTSLALAEVRDRHAIYAQTLNNGDGVIPPGSVEDESLRGFIEDIMATVGSVDDLSGEPGVNQQLADEFMAGARALIEWHDMVESSENDETLLPFGTDTAERYRLFIRMEPVIDRYFKLCEVSALNEMLGRSEADITCPPEIFTGEGTVEDYMARAPLAAPRTDGILHLGDAINPYYAEQINTLAETVFEQVLGNEFSSREFSYGQWTTVQQAFAAYDKWVRSKAGGEVERIGLDKLREYVSGDLYDKLSRLIQRDLAAGKYLETSRDLEFLILLQRWFIEVCNNFVSFPSLYDPSRRAMFETGRMVMGGSVFNLNIIVPQVDSHSTVAARSGMYLLYSEITGTTDDPPFFVVTPVTQGPISEYGVGKRGVLFDTAGKQWDARVVKVVENPVSL